MNEDIREISLMVQEVGHAYDDVHHTIWKIEESLEYPETMKSHLDYVINKLDKIANLATEAKERLAKLK